MLAAYRSDPELTDVPVIVLSSIADVPEKVRAFELGAADNLVKVPHPVEMIARVRAQSRAYTIRKQRDQLTDERQRTMAQLADSNVKLARAAREDALTGLANRRALDEHLHSEWRTSAREQQPLSFALIVLRHGAPIFARAQKNPALRPWVAGTSDRARQERTPVRQGAAMFARAQKTRALRPCMAGGSASSEFGQRSCYNSRR